MLLQKINALLLGSQFTPSVDKDPLFGWPHDFFLQRSLRSVETYPIASMYGICTYHLPIVYP